MTMQPSTNNFHSNCTTNAAENIVGHAAKRKMNELELWMKQQQ